jgi:thiol:disulfide interchange protein
MKRLLFILFLSIFSTFLYSAEVKFSAIPTELKSDGSFDVVLNFSIPKNWHIYGQKTEFGSPTKIDFKLPQGFKVEKISWAKEKKFKQMGIEYGGYDGETQIFATIKPTDTISTSKTEKFVVNASWLACSDTCQPEEATAEFSVNFTPNKSAQSKTLQFLSIIFGAFLGGIILNLMPCVFPVIGIKILSFAQNAGDSKKNNNFKRFILHTWDCCKFSNLGRNFTHLARNRRIAGMGFPTTKSDILGFNGSLVFCYGNELCWSL